MSHTNDTQQPEKWRLPDISLAPNAWWLIWASGKNRADHTNFRLGVSGEFLALYDKDGVTPLSSIPILPSRTTVPTALAKPC